MPDIIEDKEEEFVWDNISDKEKKAVYDKIRREKTKTKIKKEAKQYYDSVRRKKFIDNPEYYLWLVARTRARKFNYEFNIEPSDIQIPAKCPIFDLELTKNNGYNPASASLDRVDNIKGYVKGNIRVISRKANIMKSSMGADTLEKFLKYTKGEI